MKLVWASLCVLPEVRDSKYNVSQIRDDLYTLMVSNSLDKKQLKSVVFSGSHYGVLPENTLIEKVEWSGDPAIRIKQPWIYPHKSESDREIILHFETGKITMERISPKYVLNKKTSVVINEINRFLIHISSAGLFLISDTPAITLKASFRSDFLCWLESEDYIQDAVSPEATHDGRRDYNLVVKHLNNPTGSINNGTGEASNTYLFQTMETHGTLSNMRYSSYDSLTEFSQPLGIRLSGLNQHIYSSGYNETYSEMSSEATNRNYFKLSEKKIYRNSVYRIILELIPNNTSVSVSSLQNYQRKILDMSTDSGLYIFNIDRGLESFSFAQEVVLNGVKYVLIPTTYNGGLNFVAKIGEVD